MRSLWICAICSKSDAAIDQRVRDAARQLLALKWREFAVAAQCVAKYLPAGVWVDNANIGSAARLHVANA